ncbi:MAG: helix-turn-helix transcriptional regulator [Lachnospiraceae bacterium]|nr:helix-turn-helix transcriptional regulator [Lachnospiraceae bacterium]MBP5276558.1 helix-turn-helix transcriptional regulator [Lachnospiraceae bacterium]MBP5565857.1 helix-turn-helix transcriptional regulator [Lachnospiraceae bacterium]
MDGFDYMAYIKHMESLPEKEKKLYYSVSEYIKEGRDISTLKVSEISSRAGIGKGTTYGYFESKEELITKAVHYLLFDRIKTVLMITQQEDDFKNKFYKILDYIWENKLDNTTLQSLARVLNDIRNNPTRNTECNFELPGMNGTGSNIVEGILEGFLNQGYKEGIFSEPDLAYRKDVLCTQVVLFVFLIQEKANYDKEEVEDYVYNGFVALLNLRK